MHSVSIRFLPQGRFHAKERGIEAIKVQHYPGLRRAHNEQIFNRHKPVLDAMGDQAAYIGPIGAGTIAKLAHNCTSAVMGVALAEVFTMGSKPGRAARFYGRRCARVRPAGSAPLTGLVASLCGPLVYLIIRSIAVRGAIGWFSTRAISAMHNIAN